VSLLKTILIPPAILDMRIPSHLQPDFYHATDTRSREWRFSIPGRTHLHLHLTFPLIPPEWPLLPLPSSAMTSHQQLVTNRIFRSRHFIVNTISRCRSTYWRCRADAGHHATRLETIVKISPRGYFDSTSLIGSSFRDVDALSSTEAVEMTSRHARMRRNWLIGHGEAS